MRRPLVVWSWKEEVERIREYLRRIAPLVAFSIR